VLPEEIGFGIAVEVGARRTLAQPHRLIVEHGFSFDSAERVRAVWTMIVHGPGARDRVARAAP